MVERLCNNYKITPILLFPNNSWRVLDFSDLQIISETECVLGSETEYLVKILRQDFYVPVGVKIFFINEKRD